MRGVGRFGGVSGRGSNAAPATGGLADINPSAGGQTAFTDQGRRKPWSKTPPELLAVMTADVQRKPAAALTEWDDWKSCRDLI